MAELPGIRPVWFPHGTLRWYLHDRWIMKRQGWRKAAARWVLRSDHG